MPSNEIFRSTAIFFSTPASAEHDRPGETLISQACSGGNNARVIAFRQNDFAIAPPCDIKQPIK